MFGIWGKLGFKNKEDFRTHKQYLHFMYSETGGFIARFEKPVDGGDISHNMFTPGELASDINKYFLEYNVYTSMNSFETNTSRKINDLKRLNALYIDIDCYKVGLTKEQVIYWLKTDYFGRELPCPTFIIDSGRGLYLIWKIDEDKKYLSEWTATQEYFYKKLKDFGADKQALDAARVLRVPYSVNSASNTTVKILEYNDVKYTLAEIMEEYNIKKCNFFVNFANNVKNNIKNKFCSNKNDNPQTENKGSSTNKKNNKRKGATQRMVACATEISQEQDLPLPNFGNFEETFEFIGSHAQLRFRSDRSATEKQVKYATKIAEAKELELPDFSDFNATSEFIAQNKNKQYNSNSWLDGWRKDVEILITSRKGENCRRQLSLFLTRLWLCETTRDYEGALKSTLELNSRLDKPFTEEYVRSHTQSAETKVRMGETYRYTKQSIIELLKITDAEAENLKYLNKDPNEARRERDRARKKAEYDRKLEESGKNTKKEEIRIRREKLAVMLNEGIKTVKEICAELKISLRTFYYDRVALIKAGLVSCTSEAVRLVSNTANKITGSILDALREAADNLKEFTSKYKRESKSEYDILKEIQTVRKKC